MDVANRRARAVQLVNHVQRLTLRKVLLTPLLNFPWFNTVYYSIRGFAQLHHSSDVVNHDSDLVLHGKGVVAFTKVVSTEDLLSPADIQMS